MNKSTPTVKSEGSDNGRVAQSVPAQHIDLTKPSLYINRELSHIEFNRRVLHECYADHPLLEQVKFLAIFTSNMDEFFMVRVSGLKQQVLLGITDTKADGLTPREQLVAIHRVVTQLYAEATAIWQNDLHPQLEEGGIHVLNYSSLPNRSKKQLRTFFDSEIFPVLTPLAFDPSRPFPHISNLSLNLAVVVRDPETEKTNFARVKVPAILPRLVPLKPIDPDELLAPAEQKFVWLEEVIAANLDRLFPGMQIVASYPFRVTRNTDMEIQEEEADDLLLTMEENLRQRHFGSVVRLEIVEETPDDIRKTLITNLQLTQYDIYTTDGPLGFSSLWQLHKLERPDLKDKPFQPAIPDGYYLDESIFDSLSHHDILLHHPYDSFGPVVDFLEEAAADPDVLAIKQTLYRVGPNPPIVRSLMRARENGKQVTVLVELKARFDEESNIEWARALENAGVHVVYGLIGLKTHCKLCLIVRREGDGINRYLHLSTGNYNAITARLYTDIGLMTDTRAFGADATELFNYLTGYSNQRAYRRFLVAPVNLRQGLLERIEREIELGEKGHIIVKSNSLVDPEMIQAFYRASQAGVKVQLIIRGICCLRPGLEGISDNIEVMSIVGRFLEHSRIYYFHNDNDPEMYIGSADLMPRNIDRRVEVLFPIEHTAMLRQITSNILDVYLADTEKAYVLLGDGTYVRRSEFVDDGEELFNSQLHFLQQCTSRSSD
ncbi:MAG: polyphosphate kinase 1 [Candidatus Promineifilaceae bacterium]